MIAIGFCIGTFGVRYADLREAAQQIDSLGFDSIWVWDHYVSWNDPRESVLEGLTTLAALAEITQHVHLGPLVANNTNRHPGRLAKIVATLNEISGGRAELGIGAGGYGGEQERFGIEQGGPGERTERLEEALQIIPTLWTGQSVNFQGHYYQLHDAICAPAQNPPPRLIVGASTPRTARLAGHYADGLNLQWRDRDKFPQLLAALDEGLAQRGRSRSDFDLSLHPSWNDLVANPNGMVQTWENLGFNRALVYVQPPLSLSQLTNLAKIVVRS